MAPRELTKAEYALLEKLHDHKPPVPGMAPMLTPKEEATASGLLARDLLERSSPRGVPCWVYTLSASGRATVSARRIAEEMRHPQKDPTND